MSIPSSNIIYTCGSNGKILKSANEGNDWISYKTPAAQMLNSIYFFDNQRGFAVGDSGTILYTQNGGGVSNEEYGQLVPYGLQDKIITVLSGEEPDYSSSLYNSNFQYIFAGTQENGIFSKSIAAENEESLDWIPVGFRGRSISALSVQHWGAGPIDGSRLFAAVALDSSQNDSTLILSREVHLPIDTNWIKSDSGINNSVKRINSLNSFYYTGHTPPQPVIAGTNSGIYRRASGLWSQSEIEDENSQPEIISIDVSQHWFGELAWAAGYIESPEIVPVALRSTDQGITWKLFTLANFEASATSIAINKRNPDSVYVSCNNNIYLSPDGGNSWETVFTSRGILINTVAVDPLNPENVFAGGLFFDDSHQSPSHGVFLHSTNGGKDWNEPDAATDKTISEVTSIIAMRKSIDNKSFVYIGTQGTGVWEYKYSTITSIGENTNLLKKFILFQNYPNPFNPMTTIKYELPEGSKVELIIYNILGQKVAELVNSFQKAGRYEVRWNAEDFASGVYIYQLKAENFSQSRKLILMK